MFEEFKLNDTQEQKELSEQQEQSAQELLECIDEAQNNALELLAELDGTTVGRQREKLAEKIQTGDAAQEVADAGSKSEHEDVSLDERLNARKNVSFGGYTSGQCARITTGTQSYCPFSGSGR